jgi:hypothetical protein
MWSSLEPTTPSTANTVSMSTGIVAALVLTQRNGIKLEDLIEKFSWLKELIIAKGVNLLS